MYPSNTGKKIIIIIIYLEEKQSIQKYSTVITVCKSRFAFINIIIIIIINVK